jgi:hypothetical protein
VRLYKLRARRWLLGAWLYAIRPRLARRPRFVTLSLIAALTTPAPTSTALATATAFAALPVARRDGLPLIDRRDGLIGDDRLLLHDLGLARRPLLLAFAPAIARLIALAVTGRFALAPLLRLAALGL